MGQNLESLWSRMNWNAVARDRPHLAEGFALFRRCGSRYRIARGLELTARIALDDDPVVAARFWGAAIPWDAAADAALAALRQAAASAKASGCEDGNIGITGIQ